MCSHVCNINTMFILFLISLVLFVVLDYIWLGHLGKGLYKKEIGKLMKKTPNWYAVGAFYLLYVIGLVIFAVFPSYSFSSIELAFLSGALYGFFTYMTYELTNLSVIKGWSFKIALIDIAYGTVLGAIVSGLAVWLYLAIS